MIRFKIELVVVAIPQRLDGSSSNPSFLFSSSSEIQLLIVVTKVEKHKRKSGKG